MVSKKIKNYQINDIIPWCYEAIKKNPKLPELYIILGHAFRMRGDTEIAIRAYHEALDIYPNSAETYVFIADLLYARGELEKASLSYQNAIKIKPSFAENYSKLKWEEEYFSLHHLDIKLKPYLNFENGFFVEAGANDGISQSNTFYLEKYKGWKGLLIEPIPELASKCRENRPESITENYALVSFDFPLNWIEINNCNLMSFVEGTIKTKKERDFQIKRACEIQNIRASQLKVPARNLSSVLDRNNIKKIDFFSLDVEGFELEVLKGIDFNKYKPHYLLVEVRKRDRVEIDCFLKDLYQPISELSNIVNRMLPERSYNDVLYQLK